MNMIKRDRQLAVKKKIKQLRDTREADLRKH